MPLSIQSLVKATKKKAKIVNHPVLLKGLLLAFITGVVAVFTISCRPSTDKSTTEMTHEQMMERRMAEIAEQEELRLQKQAEEDAKRRELFDNLARKDEEESRERQIQMEANQREREERAEQERQAFLEEQARQRAASEQRRKEQEEAKRVAAEEHDAKWGAFSAELFSKADLNPVRYIDKAKLRDLGILIDSVYSPEWITARSLYDAEDWLSLINVLSGRSYREYPDEQFIKRAYDTFVNHEIELKFSAMDHVSQELESLLFVRQIPGQYDFLSVTDIPISQIMQDASVSLTWRPLYGSPLVIPVNKGQAHDAYRLVDDANYSASAQVFRLRASSSSRSSNVDIPQSTLADIHARAFQSLVAKLSE